MRANVERDREVQEVTGFIVVISIGGTHGGQTVSNSADEVVVTHLILFGGTATVPVIAHRTGDIQRSQIGTQPLVQRELIFTALAVNRIGT
ncbi:hypothetical protein D3C76_1557330 [compost metagenome]